MYAYGDVPQPLPETVQCVDELLSSYLADICTYAYKTAQTVQRNKIKVEDFKFVFRNDPIKLGRAEELILMNKVITDARKQFDNTEGKSLKRAKNDEVKDDEEGDDIANYSDKDGLNTNYINTKVKKLKKKMDGTKKKKEKPT